MQTFRLPNWLRFGMLCVITLVTSGVCALGYFRWCVIEFVLADIRPPPKVAMAADEDESAGSPYWKLTINSHYLSIGRNSVCVGVMYHGRFTEDEDRVASWRTIPHFFYRSGRASRSSSPWLEWENWKNWQVAGLGLYSLDNMTGLISQPSEDHGVAIPCWLVASVLAPLWWRRWKRWQVHRRVMRGGCPDCGYDLRGSPAAGLLVACPECGQATIAPGALSELAYSETPAPITSPAS